MRFVSRTAVLAAFCALGAHTLLSCSAEEPKFLYEDGSEVAAESAELGSMKLALTAGGTQVNKVTAVISGKHGFHTQTHEIDVSDANGIISIFFGGLPVARGYSIELSAGQCSGTSDFSIQEDQTTLLSVVLKCPGDADHEDKETGSVSVTGVIEGGGNPNAGCDHIKRIVAAPGKQDGDGPTSTVQVVLNKGETASAITWTTGSTTGGAGIITNQSGAADTEVSFDCTANGTVYVIASVVGPAGNNCTEQARAAIECVNQNCGNGVINPPEQCDGTVLPPGQPTGTTCSNCVLVPPSSQVTCNNDNTIQSPEQCDGTALPATAPLGSTCSQCQLVTHCSDGVIQAGEECDGTTFPSTAPLGSICTNRCQLQHRCGNGVINPPEQCDGAVRPAGTTGGTCDSRCVLTGVAVCGNNTIEGTEQCDGTAPLPATAPLGATCSNCTITSLCSNGVVNPPEQCDGSARPTGTVGGNCDARCVLTNPTQVCGNNTIEGTEQCDGTALPASAPSGSTCTACTLHTGNPTQVCGNNTIEGTEQCDGTAPLPATAPLGATCSNCTITSLCSNGVVNPPEQCDGSARPTGTVGGNCDARCVLTNPTQVCGNNTVEGTEQCDGTKLPTTAPAGSTCSNCTLVPPTTGDDGKCKSCTAANCADQRTAALGSPGVDPILDCVLGTNWPDDLKITSSTSCAATDLLGCYCGTVPGGDCTSAPTAPDPANPTKKPVDGQCFQQVLVGTGCTTSACVSPVFLLPANDNGKAMQYVQCKQDFCYEDCFTAPTP